MRRTAAAPLRSSTSENDDNDHAIAKNDDDGTFREANVAGVSVSPTGFLVLLQSILKTDSNDNGEVEAAFPVALTSPPPDVAISKSNMTMPELFRENADQTSVTSAEALTFLQLLNGVDMATPILPPDTLSLICVWYAFLLEEGGSDVGSGGGDGSGDGSLVVVEDELGLSTEESKLVESSDSAVKDNTNDDDDFQKALDYIRTMVRTTLPPSSDDGSDLVSYMEASPWQRARVQLPRAWLHGVRLQMLDDDDLPFQSSNNEENSFDICRIPLEFVLECSVDDGSKMMEIPLVAIPTTTCQERTMQPLSSSSRQQQKLDMSNEILQELSQNYNAETSAAFMALSLFHRYNKSGAGSADSPVLRVSDGVLRRLTELQQKEDESDADDDKPRYCWTTPTQGGDANNVNNNIDTVIQGNGLPFYRSLSQVQEEDQRVLQHLTQRNFGKDPGTAASSAGNTDSSNKQGNTNQMPQPPIKKKAVLTLEQQAMQQRLKSAWKVANEREDKGALEKIQKAMEDLEKEVMERSDVVGNALDGKEEESSLRKIQLAMTQPPDEEDGEEVVGLISELEEATNFRMEAEIMEEDNEDES